MLFAQFRGAVGCGPIPTWLEKQGNDSRVTPEGQGWGTRATAGPSTAATSGSHLHSSQGPGEEGSGCSVSL